MTQLASEVISNTAQDMSTYPLISVVIPTYNRSKLLSMTVESVLAQTYPAVEVIVVDDGSADDTAAVGRDYGQRVRFIRQDNAGVSAARNRGFLASNGEYVNFLDDDDTIVPEKIERQVAMLRHQPEAGLVHCRYYLMDKSGTPIYQVGRLPAGDILRDLVCANFVWMSAPLIRRECLERAGLFDETLSAAADYDLWLRIAQAGYPFACVQEPLGAYRVHRGSMVTAAARTEQEVIEALSRVFADPQLPASVTTVKNQAYGTWRLWLSCRHYAAGNWDAARDNLAQALHLYPGLLDDRRAFLDSFCGAALDVRVDDPLEFIAGVLNHLPPDAQFVRAHRQYFRSQTLVGLALRDYGLGKIDAAQHHLADAVLVCPATVERLVDFARALTDAAMHQPGQTPHAYVDTVLQNLPLEAQGLERMRSRVLGDVDIACAFEDYFAGCRALAARRILSALCHRPSWLRNRGVVSILARSLPKMFGGERGTL